MIIVGEPVGDLVLIKKISQLVSALILILCFIITISIIIMACVLCVLCYIFLKVNIPKYLHSGRFSLFRNISCDLTGPSHSTVPLNRQRGLLQTKFYSFSTYLLTGESHHEDQSETIDDEIISSCQRTASRRLD